jgi:tetratricopeptide (TPR) repeat protein
MSRRSNAGVAPAHYQKLLEEAIRLHQAGRLDDAAALYRKILAADKNHADALHLLGVVDQQQGRLPEAIQHIERALTKQPRNAIFHSNLAIALRAIGRLDDAIEHLRKAVGLDPAYLAAGRNLATVLHERGRLDEAEEILASMAGYHPRDAGILRIRGLVRLKQGKTAEAEAAFRNALELDPNDVESYNNLGLALKEQQRLAEAEEQLQRALTLKPGAPNVSNNLGLLCTEQGRLEEAERYYGEALKADPRAIRTLNNLAVTLKQMGRLDDAGEWLVKALQIDPRDVGTLTNYGDILNTLSRHGEARRLLEEAVRLDPSCAEAHNNLGVTLKELGRTADSIAHLERALQINPSYTPALNNLGNALVSAGDVAAGTQKFLRVLELDPSDVPAMFALATSTRHTFADSEVQRMLGMLTRAKTRADERELLHFALATVLDKRGAHDEAFEHAIAGNQLKKTSYRRRGLDFDPAQHLTLCDELISVFSPSNFPRLATADSAEEPIFVVGMPRSGTTLVEQILASHPSVFGGGELSYIPQLAADLPALLGSPASYPLCLNRLDTTKAREIAQRHVNQLREFGGGAPRVVDKMTINFLHIGLITLLFPKARIIHCRRDPRDICLSCFFHNFASPGLCFTFALEDLGFYYQQYERLMDHWRRFLPMPILEMQYEELVREPEKWTRALLSYCGLEWDDRCLAFHQTERQVKTASALQVRQPMYTRSVGRWKPYEAHLKPLLEAIHEPPSRDTAGPRAPVEITDSDKTPIPAQHLFEAALKLHQAGEHAKAREYYQQILREKPNHSDAVHLMGVLEHHAGRHAEALEWIQRAIAIKSDNSAYHSNAGLVLRALGRLEEAASTLSRAAELDARYSIAQRNLGIVLRELGRFDEAEQSFRRALALDSRDPVAWRGLGLTLLSCSRPGDAVEAFRAALSINPADFEAHNNLGIALKDFGQLSESEASHREAIRLRVDSPAAHNNLGIVLTAMGRLEEARMCFLEALRLHPDYADARHNLGATLAQIGRHPEAVEHFRTALDLNSRNAEYHNSLGASLQVLGEPQQALVSYELALSLNPSHSWAHFNRSQALLLLGRYEEGWPEWEWRRKLPGATWRNYDAPLWNGEPMPNGAVLLHTEQGLGDTLHFMRFCRLVQQRVGRVIIECQPDLVALLKSCPDIDEVVARGNPLPSFAAFAPLMSVPALLRLSADDIHMAAPYLAADKSLIDQWRTQLASLSGFRIGIAWQGNPKHRHDCFRSVDLSVFAPLANVPGVRLVSLQKGPAREQLARCGFPIHDAGETADETAGAFMDTAAIMKNMDLVISTDTAIPHLAGAVGVPVWLALPHAPDWRWRDHGETTAWYPTMRIFRQPSRGSWEPVFEAMRRELTHLTSGRAAASSGLLEMPVSPGELIDRITISEVKAERMRDSATIAQLRTNVDALRAIRDHRLPDIPELNNLALRLREVNERLWDIKNEIRDCEHRQDFGPRFIELARSAYRTNDMRSSLKRDIDRLLGSPAIDAKSCPEYPSPGGG